MQHEYFQQKNVLTPSWDVCIGFLHMQAAISTLNWPLEYKTFFMLNSAEYGTNPAHNVKVPTSVGILICISMINIYLRVLKHEKLIFFSILSFISR